MGIAYTPAQLVNLQMSIGTPRETAMKLAAIALRESRGIPDSFYAGTPGHPESSWGLWQTNVLNAPERLRAVGASRPEDLKDPLLNARLAQWLWSWNDANLARHWYIDRYGAPNYYAENYNDYLRQVRAAMGEPITVTWQGPQQQPTGGGGAIATGVPGFLELPGFSSSSSGAAGLSDGAMLAIAGTLVAVVLFA